MSDSELSSALGFWIALSEIGAIIVIAGICFEFSELILKGSEQNRLQNCWNERLNPKIMEWFWAGF